MNNVIYKKVLKEAHLAPDGETPTIIQLTEEVNGYLISLESFEKGQLFLMWYFKGLNSRETAIEAVVRYADEDKKIKEFLDSKVSV